PHSLHDPPASHPTLTLLPYTTLFRSSLPDPVDRRGVLRNSPGRRASDLLDRTVRRCPAPPRREPRGPRSWVVELYSAPFRRGVQDRKSTRLNSSHVSISYAVFCLKKK